MLASILRRVQAPEQTSSRGQGASTCRRPRPLRWPKGIDKKPGTSSLVVVFSSTSPEPRFPSVFPSPLCVTVCIVLERQRYCFCGSDILLTFPESEPTTRGQSEPSPVLPPKRADEFVSGSRLTLGTALAPTLCSYARSCTRRERGACYSTTGGVDVPCTCNPGSDRPGPEKPRAPTSASRSDGEHVGRRVR